jgi:hypothetical protein
MRHPSAFAEALNKKKTQDRSERREKKSFEGKTPFSFSARSAFLDNYLFFA